MGALTYLLGIAFGVIGLAVIDPLIHRSLPPIGELAMSVMFLPVLGVFMLAPLLVVCMASGVVWAAALRLLTGVRNSAEARSDTDTSRLGWVLLAVTAGLLVLWAISFGGLFALVGGGEFVD
jgi:Na+-transporting NADH:ubiquinone oxidoreductase subunit NqrE